MYKKIMAVASNGGHLVQLQRLFPAFSGYELILVSTSETSPTDEHVDKYYCVSDSNFQQKLRLIVTAFQVFVLFIKVRPQVIVSTGAAPGLFAVFFGALFRKKTIWIDSIANADRLSLAGRVALRSTPFCYTQWPHPATKKGPQYIGAVL